MTGIDYYELLGVSPTASQAEIKTAYRRLVKVLHPDAGGNPALFRLVREAFGTLGDPIRKAEYDRRRPSRREVRHGRANPDPYAGDAQQEEFLPEVPDIPVESIPWWNAVDPDPEIMWTPQFGQGRNRFVTVTIGWLALVVLYVWLVVGARGPFLADVLLLVPLSYLIATAAGWRMPETGLWACYAAAGGFALAGVYRAVQEPLIGAWMIALAGLGAVLPRFGQRYLAHRAADRIFTPQFRTYNLFGQPVDVRYDINRPDRSTELTLAGEKITAELLDGYLTRIPAVRIFHGLSWPGMLGGEVDHAVLCDRRLVLVSSRVWPPGNYTADRVGNMLRDGRPIRDRVLGFSDAVAAYQALLPEVEVAGVVLVYPSAPGEIRCTLPDDTPISVLRPEEFIRDIGPWLGRNPTTVDRDVFLTVLDQVR